MRAVRAVRAGRPGLATESAVLVWVVAFLLPLAAYAVQGDIGLGLLDEGFLWYGAQRVLQGELPLRDFQSYDVGRYYWAASVMAVLGRDGVLALRIGNALLAALTIGILLRLVVRGTDHRGPFACLLVGASILLWITPDYKVADMFASACLLAGLAGAVERPGPGAYARAGAALGLAAMIGINHALYGTLGACGVIAYLAWRGALGAPARALTAWAAGAALGYAPMMLALALVPGFAFAFVDAIVFLFEYGATNIALPVPRVWDVPFGRGTELHESLHRLALGLGFAGLPLAIVIGSAAALRRTNRSDDAARHGLLVASACLMPPYAHYAFSRADAAHLAGGILPFLVAAYALSSPLPRIGRWVATLLVAGFSLAAMLPEQPAWSLRRRTPLEPLEIAGDRLRVPPAVARDVAWLRSAAARHAPGERRFLVAPFWPGAYAVLRRASPTWEIYPIFPLGEGRQRREIARLAQAGIGFAWIDDTPLDGRAELAYGATHHLVIEYLLSCFRVVQREPSTRQARLFTDPTGRCAAPRDAQAPAAQRIEPNDGNAATR